MKKVQKILICSLLLNMLFLVLSGLFIYRRGGIHYIMSKVAPSSRVETVPAKFLVSPLYLARMDLFAQLPRRSGAVVFVGDSITAGCPWNELLQRPVLNRGIGGDTVEHLRHRIGDVLRDHPRQLFLMIGINDLCEGKTANQVWAEYQRLINKIMTDSPQTCLFIESILPVNTTAHHEKLPPHLSDDIVKVNKELLKTADGKHVIYIDLYSHMVTESKQLNKQYTTDGIHLNGAGYIRWRELLRPYLSLNNSFKKPPKFGGVAPSTAPSGSSRSLTVGEFCH
jgi:lysophospholipase L1-like esterase